MSELEYTHRLQRLENDRRRLVGEMMQKPFGDRVMSDARETELDEIECELLKHPPVIGHHDGEPVYAGRGLRMETDAERELLGPAAPPCSLTVIPQDQWPAYIEGQDGEEQLHVERYVKYILNQGSVGSCGGEGITGAIMAAENQSGQTPTKLNGYFPYHWSSGGYDQGSTLSENIRVVQQRGVASEAVWPRSNGFRREPSQAAKDDAKQHTLLKIEQIRGWAEFGTALLLGWPVYFGYTGHAIFGARLIALNRFDYVNSWGYGFGENGVATISNSRIQWGYGVYVVMAVTENRQ